VRHFVPAILEHGEEGHVVNTASVAGFQYRRGALQGPYSVSKFAVVALSEALEFELQGKPVGVSVLCPGAISTNLAHGARNRPDHLGGGKVREGDESMLAERLATIGMDPARAGDCVLEAIRSRSFYAFISNVPQDRIRDRHRRIEAALDSPWITPS
jgi:short-subunit dehydrogenase